MAVRVERYGGVEPLTPRFVRFLEEALKAKSLDAIQAPTELRADYACFQGLLAIEVKTLQEDASSRISNLTEQLEKRADWPAFYGSWPFQSLLSALNDSKAVQDQMYNRIGRAIVDHITKANKQLAAHAKSFPGKNMVRIVIMINEDHEVYSPEMVTFLVQREMARTKCGSPRYESIDAVLFISERTPRLWASSLHYQL